MIRLLKPWMLPIAMLCGLIFHTAIEKVQFLAPYLIFAMLFITFCKVDRQHLRLDRMTWMLLMIQFLSSIAAYLLLRNYNEALAQGAFMCFFCPTATAAPVITGMLGGSVARVAIYSLASNLCVAITAPALFEYMSGASLGGHVSFMEGFTTICSKVGPLIILPMITAFALAIIWPKAHHAVATHQSLSFYIWAVSLLIVVGRSVSFVMSEPFEAVPLMIAIGLSALAICVLQFIIGRKVGRRCGDPIAGAQGLAQKNTVLAIWMCLNFLNPISSVAPAAYILWQNTINSGQIYFKSRREAI